LANSQALRDKKLAEMFHSRFANCASCDYDFPIFKIFGQTESATFYTAAGGEKIGGTVPPLKMPDHG